MAAVGYSGTALAKKLGIKPGGSVLVTGAPDTYRASLEPLPDGVTFARKPGPGVDMIHLFTDSRAGPADGTGRCEGVRRGRGVVRVEARDPEGAALRRALPRMSRALALLLALVLTQAHAARFEIGLVGDAPYTAAEEVKLRKVFLAMNAADLAFVVHVGDLHAEAPRGGPTTCTEAMLADRKALLQSSRHPLVFTPGDNDWTDCHGGTPAVDPVERLNAIRRMFHGEARTLGQKTLPVRRQGGGGAHAKFVENLAWERDGVLFLTLHMVGSNNNLGRSPESDAEHVERNVANLAWMKLAFEAAEQGKHKAVVIFTQANPFFEDRWPAGRRSVNRAADPPTRPSGFRAFLVALELEVAAFERPVLFVHGDTHYFRVDKPLFDTASGRILENFTRVESFGSPYVHWVRIVVDTERPGIFEARPELVAD